jgi:hypothetical protein
MTREETFHAELDALKEHLNVRFRVGTTDRPPLYVAWKKSFGDISPAQLFEHFKREVGNEPPFHLSVKLSTNSNEVNLQAYQIWDAQKQQVTELSGLQAVHITQKPGIDRQEEIHERLMQNLFLQSPCHFSATVTPGKTLNLNTAGFKEKGKGRAQGYLRAYDGLAEQLHIPTMTLYAQNIGGYAWARYGFTPSSEEDWNKIKSIITTDVYDGKLLVNKQKIPLSQAATKALKTIEHASYRKMPEAMNALLELREPITTADGTTEPLVKRLLLNSEWNGDLVRDPKDLGYQRFQTYTGLGQRREVAA